ncbi:MAG TPA: hypothetical protein VJZ92_04940, partial [Thermodesulfobacteriota bacterium]|nr:hypothetical protein [Thermodesulfobacteriota bacterium]
RANAGVAKEDDGNSEIMMTPRKKPHRILKIFANPLIMPPTYSTLCRMSREKFSVTLTNRNGLHRLIAITICICCA